ncbi:MAG: (Fe-S)-binding protein [Elusimicrobia bacterium]|nr:(Fe-S)-binding protein [Elusimicrobiota bacterium]
MTVDPDLISRPAAPGSKAESRSYDDVMHCNRCGFCTSFCPTYLATGDEGLSPRGRNQTWRALMEGRLDPSDAKRSFDTCLLCGICTSVCFAQVPTARLMSQARETVRNAQGAGGPLRFFLRHILPRPTLFEGLLKILYVGKKTGVSRLLNRWGVLRWISPRLEAAEEAVDRAPTSFLRDLLPAAEKYVEVVHFLSCGPNCVNPEIGLATAHILKVQGVRAGTANTVCCGLPGQSFGDLEAARILARKNIEVLENYPQATILIDDSSCAATVKEWPRFFEDDPVWRARAEAVSRRAKDVLEWLTLRPLDLSASSENSVVTYHDACKARYAQGLVTEPRRLLAGVPGIEYRELPEADQCCGGGGTYQFMQPEISKAVGQRKAENIAATGATLVLTSSVSCLLQLRSVLRKAKSKVQAFHIVELLAKGAKPL